MKHAYITIEIAFITAAIAITTLGVLPPIPPGLLLPLLGLAVLRVARSLSFNAVFEWLRESLDIYPEPDSSGAGDSNVVRAEGWKRPFAELIACPICTGTWSALALVACYALVPPFGTTLLWVLGGGGLFEVIHWAAEMFEWRGRMAREEAGSQWLAKNTVSIFSHEKETIQK